MRRPRPKGVNDLVNVVQSAQTGLLGKKHSKTSMNQEDILSGTRISAGEELGHRLQKIALKLKAQAGRRL